MIEVMIKYDGDEEPIIEEFADMGHLVRHIENTEGLGWFELLDSEDEHTFKAYLEFCEEQQNQCAS